LLATTRRRPRRRPHPRSDVHLFVAYYVKTGTETASDNLPAVRRDVVYRAAFSRILWALSPQAGKLEILCDDFEGSERLLPWLQAALTTWGIGTVRFGDSAQEKALQAADIVAGTTRRHVAGDPNEGRFALLQPLIALGAPSVFPEHKKRAAVTSRTLRTPGA